MKRALCLLALLILALPAHAGKVRVLCNPDGTVAVLHAVDVAAEYKRLGEKRPYFDMDSSKLPARSSRASWRWKKASRRYSLTYEKPGVSEVPE